MASKNLAAQNEFFEIQIPRDSLGKLVVQVGSGAVALCAVSVSVEGYTGTRTTINVTKMSDDTRVSSLTTGEAAMEETGPWQSVRVTRTDAVAGDCPVFLAVR